MVLRTFLGGCCASFPGVALVVVIVALLLNSSLRLDLKLSRGIADSSAASAERLSSVSSPLLGKSALRRAMIASMDSSSWLINSCSDILITHEPSQGLQRAELQLFDCAFAPAQLLSNLAN